MSEEREPPAQKPVRIALPFDDAIAAALETPPEPDEEKPWGKRDLDADRSERYPPKKK